MGKTIDQHEMIADLLDEIRTDIQALRALAMHAAWHEEIATKLELAREHMPELAPVPVDEIDRRSHDINRLRGRATPLLKYLAGEKASRDRHSRCIQIHGGNGYIQEYGMEKLLRDAMVLPIYEGTSQIQALMAMKDSLGQVMKTRRVRCATWRCPLALALGPRPLERRVAKQQLIAYDAIQFLIPQDRDRQGSLAAGQAGRTVERVVLQGLEPPSATSACAMLHAERLTRILADVQIAEILPRNSQKDESRRELCERWLERIEVRDRFLLEEIQTTGKRVLAELARKRHADERAAAE